MEIFRGVAKNHDYVPQDVGNSSYWLWWIYPKAFLGNKLFDKERIFELYANEKMENFTNEIAKELNEYIEKIKKEIEKLY